MDITVRELAGQITPMTWVLVGLAVSYLAGAILIRKYVQENLDDKEYWKNGSGGPLAVEATVMFLFSPISVPLMLAWKFFSFRKEV